LVFIYVGGEQDGSTIIQKRKKKNVGKRSKESRGRAKTAIWIESDGNTMLRHQYNG